ncbi:hypothetical protein [Nocardia sp. NPDC020380]|uniref:hypothetical protein n=1 Tax=Nocardia sp. NPDC020380 TaxID=3364309 RepID=UPI0037BAED1B
MTTPPQDPRYGHQGYGQPAYGRPQSPPPQQLPPQSPPPQQLPQQQQFLRQFTRQPSPPPPRKSRLILLAVLGAVVILALGAVVAIVATLSDDGIKRATPATRTSSPATPIAPAPAAETTSAAPAAAPSTADLTALLLSESDVPSAWTETPDRENWDDPDDANKVSGETPDCTTLLRQYSTPGAPALAKAKTAFARTGTVSGPTVKTSVQYETDDQAEADFQQEKNVFEKCPAVIYDGLRISYTKTGGTPSAGDEIVGWQLDATTDGGGRAKGLHYAARSGNKLWIFDYNANSTDYVDSEATTVLNKALDKWKAGVK